MWELAGGTFSGRALAPAPSPSLWSNRRGRQLIGDLGEEEEDKTDRKSEKEDVTAAAAKLGNYQPASAAVVCVFLSTQPL